MSMLPFLKKERNNSGISMEYRKSDASSENRPDDSEAPLRACAQDLIKAVHSGDDSGVMHAIKAAFEILDSEPHSEGPHLNEDES
jgi:hypothetical protein